MLFRLKPEPVDLINALGMEKHMGPSIAYYFKRIYGNVIKWWFAIYNPVVRRIWPTKQEEEAALAKESEEEALKAEDDMSSTNDSINDYFGDEELQADYIPEETGYEEPVVPETPAVAPKTIINDTNYNATTGAYSGLYGTGPVDSNTQSMLDEIMGRNNAAHSIDNLIPGNEPDYVDNSVDDEMSSVIDEANAIYERLMREAAEDEAKKQAEIDAAKAAQV